MIKHFDRNTAGRDFAVGDIHGCFSMLQKALSDLAFDESRDRLFSVGDLVDRGPESDAALDWLDKPWFHAVRGNHEQMAIDYGNEPYFDARTYVANGGGWNVSNPRSRSMVFADAFSSLPLGIEIETDSGLIGIVHADCPFSDWAKFRAELRTASGISLDAIENVAMWSRDRFKQARRSGVQDLRALIVGHTHMQDCIQNLGNVYFIDTGAVFDGGNLTILELESLPK